MAKALGRSVLVARVGLLTLAALVLVALLGEVAARCLTTPEPAEFQIDPLVGGVRAPGWKGRRLTLDVPPRPFTLETNVLGFRGRSITTVKKPPGVKRVFFIGASVTDCSYLPEEETFAGRVEALLRKRGVACEVANTALSGTFSPTTLATLEHRVLGLEPDVVVHLASDGYNDFVDSLRPEWDPSSSETLRAPRPPSFKDCLAAASRLFGWIQEVRSRDNDPHERIDFWRRARRARPFQRPEGDLLRALPRFERLLRDEAIVCAAAKVPLVLATFPSLYKEHMSPEEDAALWLTSRPNLNLEPAATLEGIRAFDEGIREVARAREGVLLVDAERIVPKDLEHLLDDVHLTSKGCAVVASAIDEALARSGLLTR